LVELEQRREAEGILTNSVTGSPIKRSSSDLDTPGRSAEVGSGSNASARCRDERSQYGHDDNRLLTSGNDYGTNGNRESFPERYNFP